MSSYRQIFKSSALFGGTQLINIVVGIVRTKFLAIALGPSGVGVAGMYQSSTELIGTIAGVGVNRAGVRQIAEALGTGKEEDIALTVRTLRLVSLFSGVVGMLSVLLLCKPLSLLTFGNKDYVVGVAIVSLVLLFNGISNGQLALLQGMRKLKDLAVCQMSGAIFGAIASVLIVYLGGEPAVAWYVVSIAVFAVLPSWWYARKIEIKQVNLSFDVFRSEASRLLQIGTAFMLSGLLSSGTIYFSRVLVIGELGIKVVGLYTAVITLSSIYVNVILQAMSADYYPRLTTVANDNAEVNRMVNEQTEIGFLFALPGILGTLTLAPWVLEACYSPEFVSAASVIQWQIIGVGLCVVSWPIGIIMLAKGLKRYLICSEFVVAIFRLGALFIGMKFWGFEGVGVSFVISNLIHMVIVYWIARKSTNFRWSVKSMLLITSGFAVIMTVFIVVRSLPSFVGTMWGLVLTLLTTFGCVFVIKNLLRIEIRNVRKV